MPKTISASEYLSRAIDLSQRTQREIAKDAGYDKPNVLSMMKTGITKIPLGKVPALAAALNVDPKYMMRVVLQDYYPDIWDLLEKDFEVEMLSDEERKIILKHREERAGTELPKRYSTDAEDADTHDA